MAKDAGITRRQVMQCPICQNADYENSGAICHLVQVDSDGATGFKCDVCGNYKILNADLADLTQLQRAVLSHRLRSTAQEGEFLVITPDLVESSVSDATLPSPAIQACNIIRYIGDAILKSGEPVAELPLEFRAVIGTINRETALRLIKELCERNTIKARDGTDLSRAHFRDINLTLDGWKEYESEKRGEIAGKYGFIAMKFGDQCLDDLVENVIKPAVKEGVGYVLQDMRDVARAGIIDNIMRIQIRDSAFVIVDLTHDNSGAYWEAGYAEGLGKPVIYICEKSKFDQKSTHFDTNHCTTVPWSQENGDEFPAKLVATLRRSLNLFPEK